MLIRDVLASKGSRVVSTRPSKPLGEVVRLLRENKIGSIVVVNANGSPLGLVTERRLIGGLSRFGSRFFELTAADIMMTPPPMASCEMRVSEALRYMTDQRVRHIVVIENENIVGLVSIGDLVKCRLDDFEVETKVLRELALAQLATV